MKFTIVQHNIEKDKIGESTQEMDTAAVEKLQNIEAQTVEFLDDDLPNVVIKPNTKDKKNTKEDDSKPTDNSEIGIEVDMPEAVEKHKVKLLLVQQTLLRLLIRTNLSLTGSTQPLICLNNTTLITT